MARERLYDYPETEYSRAIARLGWSQVGAARALGIDPRTSRRYIATDLSLPDALVRLLRIAVHMGLDASEFDAETCHTDLLVEFVLRHKIRYDKYQELISKPIR